jgi:hypothetical protein
VNAGITESNEWKDMTIKTPRQAFLAGLSCGLKSPIGRGPHFVLVHARNEHGFVPKVKLVFLCKNITDAHEEMDREMYKKYFSEQLLPNLPPKPVTVVDNVSYHSRKKRTISNNIPFGEDLLKEDFMDTVDSERSKYDGYTIHDMAKAMGHSVLHLLPYHCELNQLSLFGHKLNIMLV